MSLFGSYNNVIVMGKMTRDPEIRTTPSGAKVCEISVAVSDSVKQGDKWVEETTFVDVTVWQKTAELVERFGGKGKTLLIAGRLKMDKWTDKATQQPRSKLKVVADSVTFVDGKEPSGGNAGSNARNERRRGDAGGYRADTDDWDEPKSADPRKRGDYKGGYNPPAEEEESPF